MRNRCVGSLGLSSVALLVLFGCGGKDAPLDAGTDPDASTDAGRADAGMDAGMDAGARDAGGTDGGANDAGPTDSGTDAPVPICTPGETRCADEDTLEVCEADGLAYWSFACTDGCDATAEPAACGVVTLSGWELHVFELTDDLTSPNPVYTFSPDGTVATQSVNALPSVYYNMAVLENVRVRGRITVQTTIDDDLIGMVFGWQDPEHFYVVDWKQLTQTATSPCGTAPRGVALRVANASAPLTACAAFWSELDTPGMSVLASPRDNDVGWVSFVTYDFVLEWRPGDIRITIERDGTTIATVTSTDSTYTRGSFGFYNYSQEAVRYEMLRFEPLP